MLTFMQAGQSVFALSFSMITLFHILLIISLFSYVLWTFAFGLYLLTHLSYPA